MFLGVALALFPKLLQQLLSREVGLFAQAFDLAGQFRDHRAQRREGKHAPEVYKMQCIPFVQVVRLAQVLRKRENAALAETNGFAHDVPHVFLHFCVFGGTYPSGSSNVSVRALHHDEEASSGEAETAVPAASEWETGVDRLTNLPGTTQGGDGEASGDGEAWPRAVPSFSAAGRQGVLSRVAATRGSPRTPTGFARRGASSPRRTASRGRLAVSVVTVGCHTRQI